MDYTSRNPKKKKKRPPGFRCWFCFKSFDATPSTWHQRPCADARSVGQIHLEVPSPQVTVGEIEGFSGDVLETTCIEISYLTMFDISYMLISDNIRMYGYYIFCIWSNTRIYCIYKYIYIYHNIHYQCMKRCGENNKTFHPNPIGRSWSTWSTAPQQQEATSSSNVHRTIFGEDMARLPLEILRILLIYIRHQKHWEKSWSQKKKNVIS